MVLYRILALLRKDFIWASTNKTQLVNASVPFIILFFIFLGVNNLDKVSLTVTVKESASAVVSLKQLFLYMVVIGVSLGWSSYLIFNEKIKGTLLPLLTTPLKYYEFVLAKVIFSFSLTFFSSFILILIDLTTKEVYSVANFSSLPFVVLNLALFSGVLCLIGVCIGLFARTELGVTRIIVIFTFFVYPFAFIGFFKNLLGANYSMLFVRFEKILFFDPALHFLQVFNAKDLSTILIHTAFNALYFFAFLVFNYFYLRFYFSNSREKRFSLNLFFGLAGVISLFILSGFISPHFVKRKQVENLALLELKEQVRASQSATANTWNIPIEDFFKKSEISSVRLSPNGEYLAYLKPFQSRMNIYVRKVDDIDSEKQR